MIATSGVACIHDPVSRGVNITIASNQQTDRNADGGGGNEANQQRHHAALERFKQFAIPNQHDSGLGNGGGLGHEERIDLPAEQFPSDQHDYRYKPDNPGLAARPRAMAPTAGLMGRE